MALVQSMTGFGKGEVTNSEYSVSVEIKSVNNRFKDIRSKIPSALSSIEIDLKKMITSNFTRGSFDFYINYRRGEDKSKFEILDEKKINDFLATMTQITKDSGVPMQIRPVDFLKSDFYKDQDENQYESLKVYVKEAFQLAANDLKKSRESEGEKMVEVLRGHVKSYKEVFSKIESMTSEYQKSVEEKLRKRFDDYKTEVTVDEPRFMQEVIFYLEKLDVHEEINRINAHLEKLDKILSGGGEIGRQIEFLLQELNRETNTIGSKSGLEELSDSVVKMKVQLEKIREQALNIE